MPLFMFMKKVCMYTYKIGISFFVIVSSTDCKSKWRLWRKAHICQWYTIGGSSLQCGDGQHDTHSFLHWKQRNVIFLIVVEWKMKLMFIRGIRQSLLFSIFTELPESTWRHQQEWRILRLNRFQGDRELSLWTQRGHPTECKWDLISYVQWLKI